MNSRIIPARLEHRRKWPREHSFGYDLLLYLFDLNELEGLDRGVSLFGYNRSRPVSLHDEDYLAPGSGSIRSKLAGHLQGEGIEVLDSDTLLLLTGPRVLGYVFNPVSFHFLLRDRIPVCITAEVNNTFGEKHLYTLHPPQAGGFPFEFEQDKGFHVSPFFDLCGSYRFRFEDITRDLDVAITLVRDGIEVFSARLSRNGTARPVSSGAILSDLARRPLAPHLTWPRILRQASALWAGKRITFHPKPAPADPMTIRTRQRRWEKIPDLLARRAVLAALRRAEKDRLCIRLQDGTVLSFGARATGPAAEIRVRSDRFFLRTALKGDIGLGESWADRDWDSPDLNRVMRFFMANRPLFSPDPGTGPKKMARLGLETLRRPLLGPVRSNSLRRSPANIRAHYDLSNRFFELFLDPTMTYSAALFADQDDSLEQAQKRKLRRMAELAEIRPGDHVLEIGCGWGSFALDAAARLGCRVTCLTLSREQHDLARSRIRAAGLDHLVDIRLQDYRTLDRRFDAVVSIEMLEAVGHRYHPVFFRTLDRVLRPGGRAALQVITIQDGHYDRYRRSLCWIRKHIFPGGLLPSLTRICTVTAAHTSLNVLHMDRIGRQYARTLALWRERFQDNMGAIREMGFDERFIRSWIYYLVCCEEGFTSGHIDDLQLVLGRPEEVRT
jgi:cyclopropane-fatty-acyl-phospholipid synthase